MIRTHERGAGACLKAYFRGLPWLSARRSGLVTGVQQDTRHVAAPTGSVFARHTGNQWKDVPAEIGFCGMMCCRRLREWQATGVWAQLHRVLLECMHVRTVSIGAGLQRQRVGARNGGARWRLTAGGVTVKC